MGVSKLLSPFQKFVKIESFSGILLVAATVIALLWANSPWAASYSDLWNYKLGFSSDQFTLNKPLILWINDGLMAVFFYLIGLEIKRELLIGELNSVKKAMFPLFGAIGGMTIPVLLFLFLNNNPETTPGWGIPMATDIAFSLAILKALGNRVPLSLKIFLTAFAIVDDIGAVMVIAIFYSGALKVTLLGYAGILLVVLYLLSWKGYYSKFINILLGIIVWTLFLKAGVHPTLAGILLAFAVPVRQNIGKTKFVERLGEITGLIKSSANNDSPILTKKQIEYVDNLEDLTDQYQSPLQRLEHQLHGWVAYVIIPIFALANAGVALNSDVPLDTALVTNIAIALVIGNSVGISTLVLLAKKFKIITVPQEINSMQIVGVAFLAGVGFTMSIFICGLAYAGNSVFIDSGKIGIIIGSLVSGIIGYVILRFARKEPYNEEEV